VTSDLAFMTDLDRKLTFQLTQGMAGGSPGMGKGAAKAVLEMGGKGTPCIVSHTESKLMVAAAEISPADPSKVKWATCNCFDDVPLTAFFEQQAIGSFHHLVPVPLASRSTVGASADQRASQR